MRWGLGVAVLAVLAACRPAAGANAKQTGAVMTSEGASLRKLGEVRPGITYTGTTAKDYARVRERVNHVLGSVETRWLLEKPLAFPWLFCDAVLGGRCQPFIYRRVVNKDSGAYPKELLYDAAREAPPLLRDGAAPVRAARAGPGCGRPARWIATP